MTTEEGEQFAKEHGLIFLETSARTAHNVEEVGEDGRQCTCMWEREKGGEAGAQQAGGGREIYSSCQLQTNG